MPISTDSVIDAANPVKHHITQYLTMMIDEDVIFVRLDTSYRLRCTSQECTDNAMVSIITPLGFLSGQRLGLSDVALGEERPPKLHSWSLNIDSVPYDFRIYVALELALRAPQKLDW